MAQLVSYVSLTHGSLAQQTAANLLQGLCAWDKAITASKVTGSMKSARRQ